MIAVLSVVYTLHVEGRLNFIYFLLALQRYKYVPLILGKHLCTKATSKVGGAFVHLCHGNSALAVGVVARMRWSVDR